jgi:hypothetical protein
MLKYDSILYHRLFTPTNMIVRLIWNSEYHESPPPTAQTEQVLREEGGWWFSETFSSTGIRSCYKVISRHMLTDGKSMIELCSPLSDTFIATPCWQDGPPQIWVHHGEAWQLPFGLRMVQWQSSQQPLELQVPENIHNEVMNILQSIKTDESLVLKDLSDLSKPARQGLTQMEESPLQTRRQPESFDGTHRPHPSVPKEPYRGQVQLPESREPVSGSPKGVQTGSLCPPTLLQGGQPPRMKGGHPRGRRGPPSQARQVSQVCLIDPQLS